MITPIFRIFDQEKANEFYLNFLGFQIDWNHQFEENLPNYFQISLKDAVIHLSEHHGDASPGSAIRIKVKGLEKYHATLLEKEYPHVNPTIEKSPWDTIEMTLIDPFSNTITFYEEI